MIESWLESVHKENRVVTGTLRSFLFCDMIAKLFVLNFFERSTTAVQESFFEACELLGTFLGGESEQRTQVKDFNISPLIFVFELRNAPIENQKMMLFILQDNTCKRSSVSFELDLAGDGDRKNRL